MAKTAKRGRLQRIKKSDSTTAPAARCSAPARMARTTHRTEAATLDLGAKKLRKVLAKLYGSPDVPSVASLGRWLAKQGLTRRQARRKPGPPQLRTRRIAPRRCNDVWAIDFKGQFQTPKDRRPNYPLTVSDLKSRYLIGCDN